MRWFVVAPFFKSKKDVWIDNFIVESAYEFEKVPRPLSRSFLPWHNRKGRSTPFREWIQYWRQARSAVRGKPDGVITVFPQLAITFSIMKFFSLRKFPLICWCFNIGRVPHPIIRKICSLLFRNVNAFVVHSSREIDYIHEWFGVKKNIIYFVHLQSGYLDASFAEDQDKPFVVAMGSANRDYRTLIDALRGTSINCKIVASQRLTGNLDLPNNIDAVHGLSYEECHSLARRARLNVVPLKDVQVASGQVTVVEAMTLGRPVIATSSIGTVDYIESGINGMLVPAEDSKALRNAIEFIWENAELRRNMSQNALITARQKFSDVKAAESLKEILNIVDNSLGRKTRA